MQTKTVDVKSQKEVVGVAEFPIFDNTTEAAEHLGDGTCTAMINAQVRTNAMNNVRQSAVGKPSKLNQRYDALARLDAQVLIDCAGDRAKIEDAINTELAKMEKEQAEAASAEPAAVESDGDEDDFDDDDDE